MRMNRTDAISTLPIHCKKELVARWQETVAAFGRKIVVLDDDPTGVQTVHDVPVFTQCDAASILSGFEDASPLFFLLTNSRSLGEQETAVLHRSIAQGVLAASRAQQKPFLLISRSDSTLRGHYPLEMEVLRQTLEEGDSLRYDGELLIPYFGEGGRLTIGDVHYVAQGETLIPANETEFAQDVTFGYKNAELKAYIEEKYAGRVMAKEVVSFSLEDLRTQPTEKITAALCGMSHYQHGIVNAIADEDLMAFLLGLAGALAAGKNYLFRTAASFVRIAGGIMPRPPLSRQELADNGNLNGGVVIVGSYTQKTTRQLAQLKQLKDMAFFEFDVQSVRNEEALQAEIQRVAGAVERTVTAGQTAVVYTSRHLCVPQEGSAQEKLRACAKVSQAISSLVALLSVRPSFLIAKGGITSSDIGTRALRVRRAWVAGQILPGIPVWRTGAESKFPNLPYVIFPGNVGDDTALLEIVALLTGQERGEGSRADS